MIFSLRGVKGSAQCLPSITSPSDNIHATPSNKDLMGTALVKFFGTDNMIYPDTSKMLDSSSVMAPGLAVIDVPLFPLSSSAKSCVKE